jgi:hypothetical protein
MSASQARGVPLTVFLVALSLGSLFVAVSNAMLWHRMVILFPPWAAYTFAAIGALRLVAVVGLWLNSRAAALLYVLLFNRRPRHIRSNRRYSSARPNWQHGGLASHRVGLAQVAKHALGCRLTIRSSGPCGRKFPVQSCVAARTAA